MTEDPGFRSGRKFGYTHQTDTSSARKARDTRQPPGAVVTHSVSRSRPAHTRSDHTDAASPSEHAWLRARPHCDPVPDTARGRRDSACHRREQRSSERRRRTGPRELRDHAPADIAAERRVAPSGTRHRPIGLGRCGSGQLHSRPRGRAADRPSSPRCEPPSGRPAGDRLLEHLALLRSRTAADRAGGSRVPGGLRAARTGGGLRAGFIGTDHHRRSAGNRPWHLVGLPVLALALLDRGLHRWRLPGTRRARPELGPDLGSLAPAGAHDDRASAGPGLRRRFRHRPHQRRCRPGGIRRRQRRAGAAPGAFKPCDRPSCPRCWRSRSRPSS